MRGLADLPVELLQIVAGCIGAGAAAKAANNGVPYTGPANLRTVGFDFFNHDVTEDEADPESEDEMEDEMAAETDESDESDDSTIEAADQRNVRVMRAMRAMQAVQVDRVVHITCDLAALSLTNQYLHRVFDPLLYQWDWDRATQAVSWAIRQNSLATLEKALSLGLDVNAKIYPFSSKEEAV